jgi:ABC-type multidrug transport system fused ATPase/permease subunit
LNTVLVTWYFTQNARSGFRVRTALNGLLYEKSLKLSGRARQQFSTGQMVNLMTNDSSRLEMAALFIHYIWSGPFQIFVILALLYKLIGWSVLVGFTIFLVFFPIQAKIAAWLGKFRKVCMPFPLLAYNYIGNFPSV